MSSRLPTNETHNTPDQLNFDALPPQQWPDQWHPTEDFPTPQSVTDDQFGAVINDAMSYAPAKDNYRLGAPHLTVAPYREYLADIINEQQASVIISNTGTGKSSQLGLIALEAEHARVDKVFVTSPRIIAARDLKSWARLSLGPVYEKRAGYMTGMASDSDIESDTRLIYITEQLLFNMINRGKIGPYDMVINDEAHERGVATVLLQGLMKEKLQDEPGMRLLVSSATIDANRQAKFLTNPRTGQPALIAVLPGVQHEVTVIHTDKSVAEAAREYMQDHNLIVCEPGLARQMATRAAITDRKNGHTIHLLHGDLSPEEQTLALNPEDHNHIVGNKVIETSLTPQGKTAVIDGGISNIGIFRAGIHVLKTVHSSKATITQRGGRVGRTQPGLHIIAQPSNAIPIKFEDRDDYDIPPIEISSVASFALELLTQGRHIENMDLPEYPTSENLAHDYKTLHRMGAITTVEEKTLLTDVGHSITGLPINVQLARMLVAAREVPASNDVVTDNVRLQVAAAVAVSQAKGILNAWNYSRKRYMLSQGHEENLSNENRSDFLFELDVFIKMYEKQKELHNKDIDDPKATFEAYLRSKDVLETRYNKALSIFEELCRREGLGTAGLVAPSLSERKAIIACQIAGADELYVQKSKYTHRDIRGESRRLGRKSTIDPSRAHLVIGSAFDLVGMRDTGWYRRAFITGASVVTASQLLQHVPERISRKSMGYGVTKHGDFVEKQALYFDGDMYFGETTATPQYNLETREFILRAMMTGIAVAADRTGRPVAYDSGTDNATAAKKLWEKAQDLENKSPVNLRTKERFNDLIKKITSASVEVLPLDVIDPVKIDDVIPELYLKSLVHPSRKKDIPEILKRSPDAVVVAIDEHNKAYFPISYRNNTAYITLDQRLKYMIHESDIVEVSSHHPVKIRVGRGTYFNADDFLAKIEAERQSPKRQLRMQRQAENAARESSPETHLAAIRRMQLGKRPPLKRQAAPATGILPTQPRTTTSRKKIRGGLKDKSRSDTL